MSARIYITHPEMSTNVYELSCAAREKLCVAINGLDRGIAHKAELHIRMCDRRLEEPVMILPSKTPVLLSEVTRER